MSTKVETTNTTASLPWQSLKSFTASTTLSEKVWRVVNNLLFVAAELSLYAIGSRAIRQAPPALSYASYIVLALTVRKIVSTMIGYAVYPATSMFSKDQLARQEEDATQQLNHQGFITQKITLYKSGGAYDATLIGHKDTIANGKWVIHAFGNGIAMERVMGEIPGENLLNGANTLLVNGSAVGRSKGFPTRYQMSAGFEAGLQFLEKEVKATHIAFKGLSLGGGMMSEAVLTHEFDLNKVKYLGVSDRTFSRLSDVAAALVGFIVTPIFYLSGAQLDSVSGAEKLKQLKIEHIIIQHSSEQHRGTDGVIPDRVSLAPKLDPAPTRTFLLSPKIHHNGYLPSDIDSQLNEKVKAFFGQA
jgi:hypothetical protein